MCPAAWKSGGDEKKKVDYLVRSIGTVSRGMMGWGGGCKNLRTAAQESLGRRAYGKRDQEPLRIRARFVPSCGSRPECSSVLLHQEWSWGDGNDRSPSMGHHSEMRRLTVSGLTSPTNVSDSGLVFSWRKYESQTRNCSLPSRKHLLFNSSLLYI